MKTARQSCILLEKEMILWVTKSFLKCWLYQNSNLYPDYQGLFSMKASSDNQDGSENTESLPNTCFLRESPGPYLKRGKGKH